MDDERWELLSPRARRARLHDALSTLDVIARLGHERGCLREHTAYVYPTSVGEWLAHAVQLAGGAIWQAPFIPLLLLDAHEAGYPPMHADRAPTRAQGADSVLTFGAALWSAVLEARDAWHDDEQQTTLRRSVIDRAGDILDEVRAESDGFTGAVQALGDAVFVFAAHVERGGNTPRVEIATCLEDALGWLCAAIACTDALLFAGLSDAPPTARLHRLLDRGGRPRCARSTHTRSRCVGSVGRSLPPTIVNLPQGAARRRDRSRSAPTRSRAPTQSARNARSSSATSKRAVARSTSCWQSRRRSCRPRRSQTCCSLCRSSGR